ncbi:peptidase M23 [Humibacillus sp. DSM 29435]|uniref:M23 family metallopeptidase n=1 Tax=Humibacillus sp. DSM 29435 TaxID=1869167 RepID=UPI0008727CCC|nr:M23 family metallopeptidase [Humibacillus sp. DSM 29435]OFE18007.1 peptidase M23 [Humibacillus sp. DSM 29435]
MWLKRRSDTVTPATKIMAASVALACTISLGNAFVARADDVSDQKKKADARIAALGQQLEGTNANLAKAYINLERTNASLPIAQAKLTAAQQVQSQALTAQAQAEATEARAVAAEAKARAHNEAVAQKLAVAQAKQQRATELLAKSGSELVSSQDALDAYAADVFQGAGDDSQLGLVFGATSPQDFADRVIMADTASNVAADTIDSLATMTADNTSTSSYLTAVRGEIATLKRQAEAALKGAEAAAAAAAQAREQAVVAKNNAVVAADNASSAKASLDTLKTQQVGYAADLKTEQAGEKQDLATAQAESARLKAVLVERARLARIAEAKRIAKLKAERAAKIRAERAKAAAQRAAQIRAERAKAAAAAKKGRTYTPKPPPRVTRTPSENLPPVSAPSTPSNFLSYPANGPTTSGFGMRWHPVLKKWMLHDGLDWGVACGTPVYAAADGTIIRAGWKESGWGNQVLIDHGIRRGVDLVTSYNHLSKIVDFGGSVKRGQLIAYSGTTGYSTGCHLHFGTYEDGTPVNPRKWL